MTPRWCEWCNEEYPRASGIDYALCPGCRKEIGAELKTTRNVTALLRDALRDVTPLYAITVCSRLLPGFKERMLARKSMVAMSRGERR